MQDNVQKTIVTGENLDAGIQSGIQEVPQPANGNYSGYSKEEYLAQCKRLDKFKNGFVEHGRAKSILSAMQRVLDWGNAGEQNGSAARCLLITGDSGCGKTAVLKRFVARFNMQTSAMSQSAPILYVQLPSDCSARWLAISVLRAMGVPEEFAARGNLETLTKRMEICLVKNGIRLLILDEFHHLLKSTNKKVLADVTEYIKAMLNTRACPIVMAGTRDAEQVYRENIQIQRRSMGHCRLDPFDWRDEADREDFLNIMDAFEANFPLKFNDISLSAEGTAWRLHRMAEGNLGRVVDFLYAVAARALQEHKVAVDLDLFRVTADNLGSCDRDWVNPFTQVIPKDIQERTARKTNLRRGNRQPKPSDIAA